MMCLISYYHYRIDTDETLKNSDQSQTIDSELVHVTMYFVLLVPLQK